MKKRVCHITTVHHAFDTRIFYRQCSSLAANGFEVHLIVVNQEGVKGKNGVVIHNIQINLKNRLQRILRAGNLALEKALEIDADIYHFHDPELLPIGLKLRKKNKPVIYDIHENVPLQMYSKPYLPRPLKPVVSTGIKWVENYAAPKMSALVAAWPKIEERFGRIHKEVVGIYNFPELEFLNTLPNQVAKTRDICFVGLINEVRGIHKIMESLQYTEAKLTLIGKFVSTDLENQLRQHPQWHRVEYLGFQDRKTVIEVLNSSRMGIATFLPHPNYLYAYPNKLFEYMAANIPAISSDFPFWKEIVETHQCGICVDPTQPKAIAEAINELLDQEEKAKEMGLRGRKAIEEHFNWKQQEEKLVALYQRLLA